MPSIIFKITMIIFWVSTLISPFALVAQETQLKPVKKDTLILQVDGLSCPYCAYGLEKKLESIEGVNKSDIRLNGGIVKLEINRDADLDSLFLKLKIDEAGFTLRKFIEDRKKAHKEKTDKAK